MIPLLRHFFAWYCSAESHRSIPLLPKQPFRPSAPSKQITFFWCTIPSCNKPKVHHVARIPAPIYTWKWPLLLRQLFHLNRVQPNHPSIDFYGYSCAFWRNMSRNYATVYIYHWPAITASSLQQKSTQQLHSHFVARDDFAAWLLGKPPAKSIPSSMSRIFQTLIDVKYDMHVLDKIMQNGMKTGGIRRSTAGYTCVCFFTCCFLFGHVLRSFSFEQSWKPCYTACLADSGNPYNGLLLALYNRAVKPIVHKQIETTMILIHCSYLIESVERCSARATPSLDCTRQDLIEGGIISSRP